MDWPTQLFGTLPGWPDAHSAGTDPGRCVIRGPAEAGPASVTPARDVSRWLSRAGERTGQWALHHPGTGGARGLHPHRTRLAFAGLGRGCRGGDLRRRQ